MKSKRILIFSLAYYPKHVGGAEVAIREITSRIDSRDIEFDLICLRFDSLLPRREKIANVNVYRIGFSKKNPTADELLHFPMYLAKVFYPFLAAIWAVKLHLRYRYDAIWAMMSYAGLAAYFFKWIFWQIPFVLTLQEGDSIKHITKRWRIRWASFFLRGVFRQAFLIQSISKFLENWAHEMGYQKDVVVIPNAVNTKFFSMVDGIKTKDLGKKDGQTFLIHTGRMVSKNALDTVIEALTLLPENICFFQIGTGPDEEQLRQLVKKLKLDHRVIFHDYVDLQEIPAYLHAADIFIRPSRSEGMGNSFIEAMAAGLPVIATQEGGIADFLFDAQRNPTEPTTGWAVDVDSPRQIAEAVLDILANQETTKSVVKTAQKMVIDKYDWDLIADSMKKQVFDKVLL